MVLLLLGMLLTVIALPVSDGREQAKKGPDPAENTERYEVDRTLLETKLESILENTEGVGKVQVLLMTGEGKQGFYGTENTEVTGVLIAAEGADDSVTVQNIQQAVMALFQIEAHKIKIMKMK
ncbi:hypothetical protein [Blautia sp. XA-2221]|uniref:hypothetical protein n=1 Tax=Blautia sp. XA-2221 TaxID=2903961 RepID=UPI002379F363|nr:hypothetical protein [Blautia sp. XA-2221]